MMYMNNMVAGSVKRTSIIEIALKPPKEGILVNLSVKRVIN